MARPHADHQYLGVDELGGDAWLGDGTIPAGPHGIELRRSVPKTDAELRRLRAESVCMEIVGPPIVTAAAATAAVGGAETAVQATSDSGAGRHMLTAAAGKIWRPRGRRVIRFETADKSIVEGVGGDVLDAAIMDERGVWRKKSLGVGFVVPSAAHTLLSIPTCMTFGLGAHYSPDGEGAWLVDSFGIRYPMRMIGDTYKIYLHVLPAGSEVVDGAEVEVTGVATSATMAET